MLTTVEYQECDFWFIGMKFACFVELDFPWIELDFPWTKRFKFFECLDTLANVSV